MDSYCLEGIDNPLEQLVEFLNEHVPRWAGGDRPQPAEISHGHSLVYTFANTSAQAIELYDVFISTIKEICGSERCPPTKGEPLYDRFKRVITPLKGILKYVDQFPPNKGRYGPCLKEAAQLIWADPEWTLSCWTPPPLPPPVTVESQDGKLASVQSSGRGKKDKNRGAGIRRGRAEDSCLHAACTGGSAQTVSTLLTLTEGPSIDCQSPSDGATPIMRACEFGHLEACQVMTEQKCDLHIKTHKGETALHIALTHSQDKVAKFLLSVGAPKCGPRCMKCKLGLKSLNRATKEAADAKEAAEQPVIVVSEADKQAEFDRVMEEEFGSMSLDEEMAKLKAEMAGSSMFSSPTVSAVHEHVRPDVAAPELKELPEWLQRESTAGEGESADGASTPNVGDKKKRSRGGKKNKKKR